MFKPVRPDSDNPSGNPGRRKRPLLRRIGVLPTTLTLGNLVLGVLAIYMCCRELEDVGRGISPEVNLTWKSQFLEELAPTFVSIAVWMLVGAIICDALDGRVARKTNQMTKFGEQMDSLADLVSWGVAPAMLMMVTVRRELCQWHGYQPFDYDRFGQLAVLIGLIYVSCAALRLARFNVETNLDAASHEGFRGLPSPGAGGAVVTLIFLHDHLDHLGGWGRTADFITHILPFFTLGAALLMVSNVPYRHMGSILMRRRPFGQFIIFLLVLPLIVLYIKQSLAVLAWAFVISGLIKWVHAWYTGQLPQPVVQPPAAVHDSSPKKNVS